MCSGKAMGTKGSELSTGAVLPRVVIVNGLPGSGKSTTARAIAERLERSVVLEGDYLQHHMTIRGLVGPAEEPADEANRQLLLRWRNLACLASNFIAEGFTVVIDSLCIPALWDELRRSLGDEPIGYVHLCPSDEVRLARDSARGAASVGQRYDFIEHEFEAFAESGPWIDSSELDVDQTADIALRHLRDR